MAGSVKTVVGTRLKVFLATLSSSKGPYAGAYRYPSLTKGRRDLCDPAQVCSCVSKSNSSTGTHLHLLPIASIPLIHNHMTSYDQMTRSPSSSTFSIINPYSNTYTPLQGTSLQWHFLFFHCPMPPPLLAPPAQMHMELFISSTDCLSSPCLLQKYLLYQIF